MNEAQKLNAEWQSGRLSGIRQRLMAEGESWYELIAGRCPHLFADVPVYVSALQLQQMTDVIAAVERVVNNEKWIQNSEFRIEDSGFRNTKGVFYGYDFHLNSDGAHLIEINTNAGGAFLNALLIDSQREVELPGVGVAVANLEPVFIEMFRHEWQLARGNSPLNCIAIVDENPEDQYLLPEFLLAQHLFERAGIRTYIIDPTKIESHEDGLYVEGQKIDLLYNRLTDFSLHQHEPLLKAYLQNQLVLTPNPEHYVRYADKRNLARLTDAVWLRELGIDEQDIAILQAGIPHTFVVQAELEASLWEERKNLFFKPNSGYGSRGAYRGDKLTKRVFGEILQSAYIAQKLAMPGERRVSEEASLKYDVRCYTYDGKMQLVAARLYQGQTTNFRTPGGGFAPVRVVG